MGRSTSIESFENMKETNRKLKREIRDINFLRFYESKQYVELKASILDFTKTLKERGSEVAITKAHEILRRVSGQAVLVGKSVSRINEFMMSLTGAGINGIVTQENEEG